MTIFRARALPAVLAIGLFLPSFAAAQSKVMTWTIDGVPRQAIVFSPSKPSAKAPLVFSFHGFGDTADNFQVVDLQNAWPEAVVVYPQGLANSRVGLNLPGWQVEKGKYGDRDLKLVDQATAALHKVYRIDDERVYATGFSNGAGFTYLLWAERPDLFAAFAPVAARLAASVLPTIPKPLFQMGGLNDGNIPFSDQRRAMQVAERVNQVAEKGEPCGANCILYASTKGAPVMTVIHDGGHEYPPGTSKLIVKFFESHPRGR